MPPPVKEAQLYDPASNTFSFASSMEFPRLYHSNTMLLPDATVVSLGGNPLRNGLPAGDRNLLARRYLFKGPMAASPSGPRSPA